MFAGCLAVMKHPKAIIIPVWILGVSQPEVESTYVHLISSKRAHLPTQFKHTQQTQHVEQLGAWMARSATFFPICPQ